jgi:hypothetical protein
VSWFERFRNRRCLEQKLREAHQRLDQAQARSADLARKREEIERIRDEAVSRRAKYQVAMRRMKDLDAELGAALAAEDHEQALKLMPETSQAHAEVERLNLEEKAYNDHLAKLRMERDELESGKSSEKPKQ